MSVKPALPSSPSSPAASAERSGLPRIVLLTTGGTIAGAASSERESLRYVAGSLGGAALIQAVPALASIADIDVEQVASIDSKDADPAFWCALTLAVQRVLARDDVDGVVITHGTDTLEETAYWLDLTVASDKPVVMTAAMRPATALSADGPANLYDAVVLAGTPSAAGRGILVALHNRIHAARDLFKASSHALDAFSSGTAGALGWVQDGRVGWFRPALAGDAGHGRWHASTVCDVPALCRSPERLPQVVVLVHYAGSSGRLVDAVCREGVAGIVSAGTGNGTIGIEMFEALRRARQQGVAVVRSSRAADVHVASGAAVDDSVEGFVASGTLNPYKSRVLLTLALAAGISDASMLASIFAAG